MSRDMCNICLEKMKVKKYIQLKQGLFGSTYVKYVAIKDTSICMVKS